MFSSRKFWIPVLLGMLMTGLGIFWVVMLALAGGAHAKVDPNTPVLGTLFSPFANLVDRVFGEHFFPPGAIAFLIQWPIYGAVVGYGNFKDKLKPYLLIIAAVHILALLVATFAGF